MQDEGSQDRWLMLNGAGVITGLISELIDVEERRVGQRVLLEISPNVFDWIELGRIRREVLRSDMGLGTEERLDDAGAVRLEPIPDQDPGRGQLPVELPKEAADTEGIDVGVRMESKVQLHPIARRRHRQRRDGRDLLMRARSLLEHRRDPARMPGAPHQGRHHEARLVDEDQMGSQARGVFFTRGQSVLTHCLIAASSRSIARRVGFCALKPMPRSSRPM